MTAEAGPEIGLQPACCRHEWDYYGERGRRCRKCLWVENARYIAEAIDAQWPCQRLNDNSQRCWEWLKLPSKPWCDACLDADRFRNRLGGSGE